MCNYYSRHRKPHQFKLVFDVPELPNTPPRYVVRPTNIEAVVAIGKDGGRRLVPMRWGLVPPWADDVKTGLTLFNARSETITEKRTFSVPFMKGRRCLVPVDGFFEFTGEKGNKHPWYIKPRDDRLMAFAGLWESWAGPKDHATDDATRTYPLLSYTIATTEPNAVVAPIHNRMPVLLSDPDQFSAWLDPKTTAADLLALLAPAPDNLLEAHPVTRDLLKITDPDESVLASVA